MAKQLSELTAVLKKEGLADTYSQYYREVEYNGRWRLFDVLEDMLLAYSLISGDKEILVIINPACSKEIENRITVDRNLSAAGSKLKDVAGKAKLYTVEEKDGRNFVSVKVKPNTFAILKSV